MDVWDDGEKERMGSVALREVDVPSFCSGSGISVVRYSCMIICTGDV